MECETCKKEIRGESAIICAGVCKKQYHASVKCSGLDAYSAGCLTTCNNLRYLCNECKEHFEVLKNIQVSVEENGKKVKEWASEIEKALKINRKKSKEMIEERDKKVEEKMKELEKKCEERIEEVKKAQEEWKQMIENVTGAAELYKKESVRVVQEIESANNINRNINKELVDVNKKLESKEKSSFADVIKQSKIIEIRKDVPLIVKPKSKQNTEKTKVDLNKYVDPKELKISNIESKNNGVIVIESANESERSKIKDAIELKMSKEYEITVPSAMKPTFMVAKIVYRHEEADLVDLVKKQNECVNGGYIKLIKQYEVKKENGSFFNAIFETDIDTFPKVLQAEKLNIGWERCKVYDGVQVTACFKCKGYNHKSINCKYDEVCLKCLGNHKTTECDSESEPVNKCINCKRANDKLNLGLDDNHPTLSKECPVYRNKIEWKKKKIGY